MVSAAFVGPEYAVNYKVLTLNETEQYDYDDDDNNKDYKQSKQFEIRPHRRSRRTVQSYSPGGANVPSYECTLAPPGEYD